MSKPSFTLRSLGAASRLLPAPAKRRARRGLRAILTVLLRRRSRPLQLSGGVLLVISPHADDGTLGCAGTILAHRRNGAMMTSLYLSDGAGSHGGHPLLSPADLAALRRTEALTADKRLGIDASQVTFLDLPDGSLSALAPDERVAAIKRLVAYFHSHNPATVMLPCRDDGSDEHEAAFRLVHEALQLASLKPRLLEYPVWAQWNPLRLLHPLCRAGAVYHHLFPGDGPVKSEAIASHASQFLPTPPWTKPVLPHDFATAFSREIEFFFETS